MDEVVYNATGPSRVHRRGGPMSIVTSLSDRRTHRAGTGSWLTICLEWHLEPPGPRGRSRPATRRCCRRTPSSDGARSCPCRSARRLLYVRVAHITSDASTSSTNSGSCRPQRAPPDTPRRQTRRLDSHRDLGRRPSPPDRWQQRVDRPLARLGDPVEQPPARRVRGHGPNSSP